MSSGVRVVALNLVGNVSSEKERLASPAIISEKNRWTAFQKGGRDEFS